MKKRTVPTAIVMVLASLFLLGAATPAKAGPVLTPEEQAWIEQSAVIEAASLNGIAPIQYTDAKGEVQGISRRVLEEVSDMTGLRFEYRLYDTIEECFGSGADILFGTTTYYTPAGMVLSRPYLVSETILYIHASVDPSRLEDKRYAAVRGSALPEGVNPDHTLYFDTREQSLDAVERGQADYGYGNAYSVAFYTLQNGYRNLITIPRGKESRAYCVAFLKENELLRSIIDKSIAAIPEQRMQNLILAATSQVDRKISFSIVMAAYGAEIFVLLSLVMCVLLFSALSTIRANKRLHLQNMRHELLSQLSNEYFYEYFAKQGRLELSEKCGGLFGDGSAFAQAAGILKQSLSDPRADGQASLIRLPLAGGGTGVFKAISSPVYDSAGKLDSVIGKLIDVSEETAEREALLAKSQSDGLTGLYNAATLKSLIVDRLHTMDKGKTDALILLDCDKLKEINDTLGHLAGDRILTHIGASLRLTFRSTDLIGRIGGDEFCAYIREIPSPGFIQAKCQALNGLIQTAPEDIRTSVSIGIALTAAGTAYEDLFQKADAALYRAKRSGRARIVMDGEAEDGAEASLLRLEERL